MKKRPDLYFYCSARSYNGICKGHKVGDVGLLLQPQGAVGTFLYFYRSGRTYNGVIQEHKAGDVDMLVQQYMAIFRAGRAIKGRTTVLYRSTTPVMSICWYSSTWPVSGQGLASFRAGRAGVSQFPDGLGVAVLF